MSLEDSIGIGFGVIAIFYLIILAFGIVSYVFQALSFYTIAKRRGLPGPWKAWVPLLNLWLMGSLSDQYQQYTKNKRTNRRKVLVGGYIGMFALVILLVVVAVILGISASDTEAAAAALIIAVLVFYLAFIALAITLVVFQYMTLYDIFASCSPGNATVFLVVSIFFGVAMPFLLFSCRNKDEGMISYQQKQWQQQQQYQAWQAQQYQAQQAWAARQQAWQAQQQAQAQQWQQQQYQAQQRWQQEQRDQE